MSAGVLALHGFTGGADTFAELDLPSVSTPLLAGHGPQPDVSIASFEEEIARLTAHVERNFEGPVHLLGYSLGARVGLGLLLRAPHLYSAATLLGLNPGLETESERSVRKFSDAKWIRLLQEEGLSAFEERWSAQPLFASQARQPEALRTRLKASRLTHTAPGLAHSLRTCGLSAMPNYWPALSSLRVPVTLVTGSEDAKFSSFALRACAENPLLTHVCLPGAGHNPWLEAPSLVRPLLPSSCIAREGRPG